MPKSLDDATQQKVTRIKHASTLIKQRFMLMMMISLLDYIQKRVAILAWIMRRLEKRLTRSVFKIHLVRWGLVKMKKTNNFRR